MLTVVAAVLVLAAQQLSVPVDRLDRWTPLAYRSIPVNEVDVVDGNLEIRVDRSSSPLVYRFEKPVAVTGFEVRASWQGRLAIPRGRVQGGEGADDFVLKFGLVEAGDRTLSWLQRRFAADWIVRLHELAPEGSGIRRISFWSTTQQEGELGTSRRHPLSDLLHEYRIRHLIAPGPFELTQIFDEPVQILGLWISADGDDTGSAFTLEIHSIELAVADQLAE